MKAIRWSQHALRNLADREVPRIEADRTIANPEQVETARMTRQIFMRRYFDERLRQPMLIRAIVEETAEELVVTTIYITSKIGKYLKEAEP